MSLGVDYAFSWPDPAAMYVAGVRFAGRYVGPGSADKKLIRGEALGLSQAGIRLVALVEGRSDGALAGWEAGRDHAQAAVVDLDRIGAPANVPLYFAVDFDMTGDQHTAVFNYFRGVSAVIPLERIGIYGGIRTVQWAQANRVARWFFQTYAWSGGQWADGVHIRQTHNGVNLAGGRVDLCQSMQPSYGQWLLAGSQLPPEGTDDMDATQSAMLAEIHERIMNINASLYLASGTGGIPPVPAEDRWGANGMSAALVDQVSYLCHMAAKVSDALAAAVDALGRLEARGATEPADVAQAIAQDPQAVAELTSAVGAGLGTLTGSLTLSGSLTGHIGAP